MFKKLNKKEMNEFIERYMPEWKKDIFQVTSFEYAGFKSYLVNEHYLVATYNGKVEHLDFQEFYNLRPSA